MIPGPSARTSMAFLGVLMLLTAACGSARDAVGTSGSVGSSTASALDTPTVPDALTPLVGSVQFAPIPFAGSDGKNHLVYELSLTNFTSGTTTVGDVKVIDDATGGVIVDLDAATVRQRLQPAGSRDGADHLDQGQSGTLFLHLTFDAGTAIPAKVTHQIEVTSDAAPPGQNRITERVGETSVDRRTLPVLSAPLKGGRYIAADACCDAVRHTRAILPVNGQTFVAQRYAIDYEQADQDGRIFTGNRLDPASYVIFGKEVLAVADGTVVGTRNDLPEQTPGTYPAGIPLPEADGNFIVLDLGDGFYANFAHLQPGSVRPRLGDKVTRGEVLGLVGNSGNSVAPHLHFHVMNAPSPLAAQGVPYLYDRFAVTGQVASTADFDAAEGTGVALVTVPGRSPTQHIDQLILDQNIVDFGP